MRRGVLAIVGLCACSKVFGLTQPSPLAAPIDGMPSCPNTGAQPAFKSSPVQVTFRPDCNQYVVSADTHVGLATCQVDQTTTTQAPHIEIELADGSLTNLPEFAPTMNPTLTAYFQSAMIAPEGDSLIVQHYDQTAGYTYWRYRVQSDGTWKPDATPLTLPSQLSVSSFGVPSRGPIRHWLVVGYDSVLLATEMFELKDDGSGKLSVIRETPISSWSVTNPLSPTLSDDGLRATFADVQFNRLPPGFATGTPTVFGQDTGIVYYMDRANIDDPFRTPAPLAGAPLTGDPLITPNCARMYFSGIGSIWYVEQP